MSENVKVRMTADFHSEWSMSEVCDGFSVDELDAVMQADDPEKAWDEAGHDCVFDYDADRIEFTRCIVAAYDQRRANKSSIVVEFTPAAVRYIRRDTSLEFQLDKWLEWGRDGDMAGYGYLRSGRRILNELGGVVPRNMPRLMKGDA